MWPQKLRAAIKLGTKDWFGSIDRGGHVFMLGALAGQQEGQRWLLWRRGADKHTMRRAGLQQCDSFFDRRAGQRPTLVEGPASDLERMSDISQIDLGMALQ